MKNIPYCELNKTKNCYLIINQPDNVSFYWGPRNQGFQIQGESLARSSPQSR